MGKVFSFFIVFHLFFLTIVAGKDEFRRATEQACIHYKAIVAIEALWTQVSTARKRRSQDLSLYPYFEDGPNSYYNQTEQGLYCAFVYQLRNPVLLTPWGQLVLERKDVVRTLEKPVKFLQGLCASICPEYSFGSGDLVGLLGPTYKISKVSDITLPELKLAQPKDMFSYEEVVAAWKEVKRVSEATVPE